jgi:hypothetical protein
MRKALGEKKDDDDGSGIADFRMKSYEEQTEEGLKNNPRTEEVGNEPSSSVIKQIVADILDKEGEMSPKDLIKKVFNQLHEAKYAIKLSYKKLIEEYLEKIDQEHHLKTKDSANFVQK